jgi:uncharacterized protein (DUF927 family)
VTGKVFEGSGGQHIYVLVRDGDDIPRFIKDAHARLWLKGFGFGAVSKAGSFLERSLIDASVGLPERLVFEAAANVVPPLEQDLEARKAVAYEGTTVDTQTCAPPLTKDEQAKFKKLKDAERERLKPEMAKKRAAWIAAQVKRFTDSGVPEEEARARAERMLDERELAGPFMLEFADPALGRVTVAQVLADPDKYIDENLADPFEGVEYGTTTAILRQRRDGTLWVWSYAHGGGLRYELKPEQAAILPRGFTQDAKGIWYTAPGEDSDNPRRTWVCAPLHVIAMTRDDAANNHGLLLRWTDPDGVEHTWAMPRELVHADGNQIARELERAGLSCGTSNKAHELLKQFLGGVRVARRVRCVARTGWHGNTLVLPGGGVIGPGQDDIALQSEHVVVGEKFAARGTLSEWQEKVSCFAVGNDLMALHLSASFAAPLLDVLLKTSGGFNVPGSSRLGKTTLLRCAKSAWGPGDDKHLGTWRATANGLEAIAAETNDLPLFLDELKQADPRQAGEIIYMLGSSSGKRRANRAGGAKKVATWNTLFMSSGEQTLEQKLAEAGQRPFAGMTVRMIELEADAGVGHGVWQTLHGFQSGAALSEYLGAAAVQYCGTAGPAFLEHLTHMRADAPAELKQTLHELREAFLAEHVSADANGQVRSVAARFALVAAAGELATVYGVTGWSQGEAPRACGALFKRWLIARGGTGALEDKQALTAVRAFIVANGSSRFEQLYTPGDAPREAKTYERAGWKRPLTAMMLRRARSGRRRREPAAPR